MLVKKYNSIMQKPENERAKWAVGLSLVVYLFIFTGFAFNKGYVSVATKSDPKNSDVAAVVVSAEKAPSPLQNSKGIFSEVTGEVKAQYEVLKESLESVFVPFFTSIEIYDGLEK
jgi:hypothetical protein